ncbi:hypothetical protein ES705_13093 [subsurface metagenome]
MLKFDEDDAAGLMTPRYLALRSSLTVAQALTWVRKSAASIETIYYIYILDELQRLIGVVSLRDILAAENEELIENIMVKNVTSVFDDTDREKAAVILETYDFLALPVVDHYNRLLGIITFDDIIDVIREEQTEDIYKMGAMGGSTDPYLESSIFGLVKKRIPWLVILLMAATITTLVGTIAPIIIDRLGKDPAVMAGPLMATIIDVSGLTIYFETAKFLLKIN